MIKRLLYVATFLGICSQASANVTYSYTGPGFKSIVDGSLPNGTYSSANHVTLNFELADAIAANTTDATLAPLSFFLSDGRRTITNATAFVFGFDHFTTNAAGAITEWDIFAESGIDLFNVATEIGAERTLIMSSWTPSVPVFFRDQGQINVCDHLTAASVCNHSTVDAGQTQGTDPGTWTLVPEPGTLSLFALGLAAFGYGARWRQTKH